MVILGLGLINKYISFSIKAIEWCLYLISTKINNLKYVVFGIAIFRLNLDLPSILKAINLV